MLIPTNITTLDCVSKDEKSDTSTALNKPSILSAPRFLKPEPPFLEN